MSENNPQEKTAQEQFTEQMASFIGAVTDLMNNNNNGNANSNGGARLKLPDSYDGTRDAVMIERWIAAIERHQRFYAWNGVKTMEFATTLLTNDADTWYRALEASQTDAPTDWLELKRLLVEAFKPPNARTLARDRLRSCVQHGTIQQYVNEFQNIKLSLSTMQEEEAIDRFVAGLADDQLVAQIRDVDEDELTLRMALNMALSFEAARRPRIAAPAPTAHFNYHPPLAQPQQQHPVFTQQYPPATQQQQSQPAVLLPMVDDPMDLDAMQGRNRVNGCFYCGRPGHIRDECRIRQRDIKSMEQQKYNDLVRSGRQQPGSNRRGGRGSSRGGRGGRGGRSYRSNYGRGALNTTETSGGNGQPQVNEQDF